MTIKFGDIDVANEIIELHFQLRKTQLLLDLVIQRSSAGVNSGITAGSVVHNIYSANSAKSLFNNPIITSVDVQQAEQAALTFVQTKYPNMGIQKKL